MNHTDDSSEESVTASELMNRLQHDPHYIERIELLARQRRAASERHRIAMKPIIDELKQAGLSANSLDELRRRGSVYKVAIPVLLKWLTIVTDASAKESIVRALSVPWARPIAAAPLIAEFQQIADPTSGLKWAIGNALAVTADDSVLDAISELVRNTQNGKAREMLVIALGNMKTRYAIDLLIELLDDDEVAGHALIALRKLKAKKARPRIERFLNHPKTWIRTEAKKTLAKLE